MTRKIRATTTTTVILSRAAPRRCFTRRGREPVISGGRFAEAAHARPISKGHPTPRLPFVDVAFGSLGQGLSVGGMALAARLDNRLPHLRAARRREIAGHCGKRHRSREFTAEQFDRGGGRESPRPKPATAFEHNIEIYRKRFAAFGWQVGIWWTATISMKFWSAQRRWVERQPLVILLRHKGAGVSFCKTRKAGTAKL